MGRFSMSGFGAAFANAQNAANRRAFQQQKLSLLAQQMDQKAVADAIKRIRTDAKFVIDTGKALASQLPPDATEADINAALRRTGLLQTAGMADQNLSKLMAEPPDITQQLRATVMANLPKDPEKEGERAGIEAKAKRKAEGLTGDLVTLKKGEKQVSLRKDDPRVDRLVNQGFTEVRTPAAEFNIVRQTALQKKLGDILGKRVDAVIEQGEAAASTTQSLTQMADLLAAGVQTGSVQSSMLGLQAIAKDLGVDLSGVSNRLFGLNLGDVTEKEQFDRLATTVIIEGFQKFKGNLNQREVEIAENAFANLGRDEESNIDAVAAGLAAAELSRERASKAISAAASQDRKAIADVIQEGIRGESTVRFRELKGRIKEDLQDRFAQARELSGEVPALDSVEAVQKASVEEIRRFIESSTKEALTALPPDISDAIMQRLQ